MSGGKEAQIAFYHQNLVTVLKILNGLRDGKLISAKIEQKIHNSNKEIDITLEFSDGHFEYYEVKSGKEFSDNGTEIKKCLKALFLHFQSKLPTEQAIYSVIIIPNYQPQITRFVADIKRFSKNKTITKSFRKYCTYWEIPTDKIKLFHAFMKFLTLEHELNSTRLKVEILSTIDTITSDLFMNADHALPKEDLLNRLIELLLNSIKQSSGVINLYTFAKKIIDWTARNDVAYITAQGHDVRNLLEKAKEDIAIKLQSKFPSITIAFPSPSPSEGISET